MLGFIAEHFYFKKVSHLKRIFFLVLITFNFHCKNEVIDTNKYLKDIKSAEGIINANFNGEDFYPDSSRFKGEILVTKNSLRVNVSDQNNSNVILTLNKNDLFDKKPIKEKITQDNQALNSLLIGKLIEGCTNRGVGYLMTDTKIIIKEINKESLFIEFKGKAAKFENFNDKTKWESVEGFIIFKQPNYKTNNIDTNEAFY